MGEALESGINPLPVLHAVVRRPYEVCQPKSQAGSAERGQAERRLPLVPRAQVSSGITLPRESIDYVMCKTMKRNRYISRHGDVQCPRRTNCLPFRSELDTVSG